MLYSAKSDATTDAVMALHSDVVDVMFVLRLIDVFVGGSSGGGRSLMSSKVVGCVVVSCVVLV